MQDSRGDCMGLVLHGSRLMHLAKFVYLFLHCHEKYMWLYLRLLQ